MTPKGISILRQNRTFRLKNKLFYFLSFPKKKASDVHTSLLFGGLTRWKLEAVARIVEVMEEEEMLEEGEEEEEEAEETIKVETGRETTEGKRM